MKRTKLIIIVLAILEFFIIPIKAQKHNYVVQAVDHGAVIQPTMYGVFFEDINFAADGGIYAELVENRSFEFPQPFQGWDVMGKVVLNDKNPAFDGNPVYASMLYSGHKDKHTGLINRGFFGMGLKKDATYDFVVYARKNGATSSDEVSFKVELLDRYQNVMSDATFNVSSTEWTKLTATLTSKKTDAKGSLRLMLIGTGGVDIDHVSLFPQDNWNGLRRDLVQDLIDLNPGVIRFPGGCIVEGSDLATRYQWKKTIGPVENRPLNENRWNNTYTERYAPNYYQSYGLGFYEYFLLAERLGAEPLPILSVGLACQFHNNTIEAHVPLKDLEPYVQDALDLIEFANGPVTSIWGAKRAEMGHKEPFNLKYIGIGNEQWGTIYPERLEVFVKAIKDKYPEMNVVGSAGPSPSGGDFDYLWKEMNRVGADLVDEHYYMSPAWFLSNAQRYDNYNRSWPKVFAGEYAAHVVGRSFGAETVEVNETPAPGIGNPEGSSGLQYPGMGTRPRNNTRRANTGGTDSNQRPMPLPRMIPPEKAPFYKNNFKAAISEAAFMTGLERNADVVYMATYAPLFAHAEGYQWDPDLIWFDNLTSVRTPNYYVQQMYAQNAGTNVLSIQEDGMNIVGKDGMYATACFDKKTGDYIVKIVNASDSDKDITISFKGLSKLGEGTLISLHAEDSAYNTIEDKDVVKPQIKKLTINNNKLDCVIPARSFHVYRF